MSLTEEEGYLNVVIYLYYLNNAEGRRGKLQLPPHHQHPYKFLGDSFFSGFIYVGFSWCVLTMVNLLFSNIRKKDTRQCGAPRISNWSIVIRGNNKNNDEMVTLRPPRIIICHLLYTVHKIVLYTALYQLTQYTVLHQKQNMWLLFRDYRENLCFRFTFIKTGSRLAFVMVSIWVSTA